MTTKIIAFALLGIFYAAYFGKKIAQKRQGIQTNQIGVGNKTTNAPYTDIARRALLPHFLRHCIRGVLQTSTTVLVILYF